MVLLNNLLNGSAGTSGFSGYSGATGPTGTSGFSGYSGATGPTGTSGFSGYSGATGPTGTSGFSGYSGATGPIGTSGFSGYSGGSNLIYDASNYWTETVGSTGTMTLTGTGANAAITIQPANAQRINLISQGIVAYQNAGTDCRIYAINGTVTTQLFAFDSGSGFQRGYVGTQTNHPFAIRVADVDVLFFDTGGKATFIPSTDTSSSGTPIFNTFGATVNQTSTAGYTGLQVAVTETATGSGSKYLLNLLAGPSGTTQKMYVDNAGVLKTSGQGRFSSIGVGNSATATVAVGSLAKKIEVFDASGTSLGFIPVYSSIT